VVIDPVARTAWLTAELRAEESRRPAHLFDDPFAARLVAARGLPPEQLSTEPPSPLVESFDAWLELSRRDPRTASIVARAAALAVRTRYFDDALLASVAHGARTVVLLAAGLDARVYRLPLPPGLRFIEVDRVELLAHKRRVLADSAPRAELLDVSGDLRDPAVLEAVARAVRGPSFWLLEGLLMYLQPGEVDTLLDAVAGQLGAGSSIAFDVPNSAYLDPRGPVAAHAARHAARGSPWTFATDAPSELVRSRGLEEDVTYVGHPRAHYGRLPWPATNAPIAGQPTSYLVKGTRR
jgi:methyltransferase (TIGR00027 family)